MLFNSLNFAIFLPVVFIVYWCVVNKSLKLQNILLLVASYFFYACWDWRFLFLLIFSTLLDYFTGLKMPAAKNHRIKKVWFWISITVNLGFLAIFKYFNFFSSSFAELILNFGLYVNPWTLQIILPVGISFYTFHGLSYVIDVYNGRIKPERNLIDYSVFVSFFPLLVAGPIERATHLLPQIQKKRIFNYRESVDGLKQILWGLFKKIVIADQCAEYANMMFNSPLDHAGSELILGAIFFSFQIYGDFSGYSDIAIGTAKLFGIELIRNFAFPYFSRDIAEFWRRWHISLSTWFRDYLYVPLGGNKGNMWMKIRNTLIVFLVSGFWHGANWTFIVWGAINALYFLPLLITGKQHQNQQIIAYNKVFPSIEEMFKVIRTFILIMISWIFFRSETINGSFIYLSRIFSETLFTVPNFSGVRYSLMILFLISFLLIVEWNGRKEEYAICRIGTLWITPFRWCFYSLLVFLIGIFMPTSETPFIYFQF